jgi:hypothetical protein
MGRKCGVHTASFKTMVALAAAKEEQTMAVLESLAPRLVPKQGRLP